MILDMDLLFMICYLNEKKLFSEQYVYYDPTF